MLRVRAMIPVLMALAAAQPATGQVATPGCTGHADYHTLDFWIGTWEVYADGKLDGHDRVASLPGGCGVTESWTGAAGDLGFSLFYYLPARATWKQVWVTNQANQPGGLKEKQLVERIAGGGLRFQGELVGPSGRPYLDRTTLTPLPSGEVHQVIEGSRDGGRTWRTLYDATYRKEVRS